MRYGNAKGAGSRQEAEGGRQRMPAKRKISSTNCSDKREGERGRVRQSEFKVQLQLQHISSESTVAWRHRTTQDAGHGTRDRRTGETTVVAGNVLAN